MGKTLDAVNRFYKAADGSEAGLEKLPELLAEDMRFDGPLMKTSSAAEYVAATSKLLPFHQGYKFLQQFEVGEQVCSIYEMTLKTPAGGKLTVTIADWIRLTGGKIAEQRIFYDPREFAAAFPMEQMA